MRSLFRTTLTFLAVFVSLVTLTTAAHAAGGLRGGLSSGPDQVLFGAQLEFSPIAKNLYIVPSVEAGFGDDLFTLHFNGDLQYRFSVDGGVRPYAGGGVSIVYADPDGGGDSNTDIGVNALGGIYFGKSTPMFVQLDLGLTDEVPDLKAVFGINFF